MAAPRDAQPPRCRNCGAAYPSGAIACPLCGAPVLDTPVDKLVEELESAATEVLLGELESIEGATLVEAEAADRTLGEVAAVGADVAEAEEGVQEQEGGGVEEADLASFVERVEATVIDRARALRSPPKPSRFAGPAIAVGGLLSATGLFLIPATVLWGSFTVMAGVTIVALGALVRYGRPVPQ